MIGALGTVVTLWLLAGASAAGSPSLIALETLAAGTVLGGVLLAGRRVSPAAPLVSGLLWAAGSIVALAGTGPSGPAIGALPPVASQLGLALAATMLLGTVAVQPSRVRTQRAVPVIGSGRPTGYGRPAESGLVTDRNLPAIAPGTVPYRRRPDVAGPRHRAAPGGPRPRVPAPVARRPQVPEQRPMPAHRRPGAVPPVGPMAPRRQWG